MKVKLIFECEQILCGALNITSHYILHQFNVRNVGENNTVMRSLITFADFHKLAAVSYESTKSVQIYDTKSV